MKLLLIRHGQSVANLEGRLQGQIDSPLSDRGRDQACALAQRLAQEDWAVSVIYTSDLSRATETAKIVAAKLGAPIILEARLREYDAGVLNGIIWREIEFLYPDVWHGLHHSKEWGPIPGEEGIEVFHQRLAAALDSIQGKHETEEAVAIVAHGGSLGMILAHLLGMDTRRTNPFRFGNASLTIVELGLPGPFLSLHNDTCHLNNNLI